MKDKKQNQKGFILPIIIAVIVIAVLGVGGYVAYKQFSEPEKLGQVVCTQDAKQCPDGSYVSRTGPNCEFAECPATQEPPAETADWKTYNESDFSFSFKYPEGWKINDSLNLKTCCLDVTNYIFPKNEIGLSKGEVKIQFQGYNKPANTSIKNFVADQTYMESNIKATSVKEVNIAGINGIFSNLTADGTYYLPYSSTQGISITVFNHPESREEFKTTIDRIISTFKFTK